MNENRLKQRVQRNMLIGSTLILIAKFVAYIVTNSAGVLTDAMESIANVVAGAISLLSLYLSAKPKDKTHPFGHGKVELLSAAIEGILIIVAGGLIIYESVHRLIAPEPIQKLDIGIYIIAVSGVVNYLMGWYSVRVGKKHRSMALIAEGRHLQSDSYSTIGLLVGLALLYFTDIQWIDSAMAILFGAIIIVSGIMILLKTSDNLLDKADLDLLQDIATTLNDNRKTEWIDIHNTKILKYGTCIHMDCDLTIPWYLNIEQGHCLGAELQQTLNEKYTDTLVLNVHLDPCNIFEQPKCHICQCAACPYRQEDFRHLYEISVNTFVLPSKELSSK